jgi:hypothetical protein
MLELHKVSKEDQGLPAEIRTVTLLGRSQSRVDMVMERWPNAGDNNEVT